MNLKIAMNTFQDEAENKDQKRRTSATYRRIITIALAYMKQVQQMIASVEGT